MKEIYGGNEALESGIDDVMDSIFSDCCQAGRKIGESNCRKLELKAGESKMVKKCF
jgi:hypothetical protein